MTQKQPPITLEEAAAQMRDMYDIFLVHFENDESIAIIIGLNQSRFNKYLPDLIIEEPATP